MQTITPGPKKNSMSSKKKKKKSQSSIVQTHTSKMKNKWLHGETLSPCVVRGMRAQEQVFLTSPIVKKLLIMVPDNTVPHLQQNFPKHNTEETR